MPPLFFIINYENWHLCVQNLHCCTVYIDHSALCDCKSSFIIAHIPICHIAVLETTGVRVTGSLPIRRRQIKSKFSYHWFEHPSLCWRIVTFLPEPLDINMGRPPVTGTPVFTRTEVMVTLSIWIVKDKWIMIHVHCSLSNPDCLGQLWWKLIKMNYEERSW